MAVQAVQSEPLSSVKFPLTGKNTGNFLDFGLAASAGNGSIALYSGHLLDYFPPSNL